MANKNSSPLKTAIRQEVKQLRSDARKLDAIANHLRSRAKELTAGLKLDERAEKARTNFFSKPASIDPSIPLTPDMPETGEDAAGVNKNPLKWD